MAWVRPTLCWVRDVLVAAQHVFVAERMVRAQVFDCRGNGRIKHVAYGPFHYVNLAACATVVTPFSHYSRMIRTRGGMRTRALLAGQRLHAQHPASPSARPIDKPDFLGP